MLMHFARLKTAFAVPVVTYHDMWIHLLRWMIIFSGSRFEFCHSYLVQIEWVVLGQMNLFKAATFPSYFHCLLTCIAWSPILFRLTCQSCCSINLNQSWKQTSYTPANRRELKIRLEMLHQA